MPEDLVILIEVAGSYSILVHENKIDKNNCIFKILKNYYNFM